MDRTQSSLSVGSALRKVESYQYPNTHVGHLSEDQQAALASFKSMCREQGYYRPDDGDGDPSHDDETLLRYLRARKFVPKDAFEQFKDTEDWRRENKIDQLYETIDIKDYDETRRLYPQWSGRRDKRGIPVYIFEVAPLNSKRMAEYDKSIANAKGTANVSPKLLRLFALYENLIKFTMPLCSAVPNRPYPDTPVSQSNNIVDIAGVGLKQFWNLRQHMQDASELATAHYPETLDRIFVIGAPSFFPTVWSWIKGWFDPITVSKIFILSKSNMKTILSQYIDPANIPKKYGGTLDWQWGSPPALEPDILNAVKWKNPAKDANGNNGFPTGPIKWREDNNGNMVAHAMGSINGKQRDEIIATIPVADSLVNLGPTMSVEPSAAPSKVNTPAVSGAEDPFYGMPSTSGVHTHPNDSQEYFPTTGVTPPEEHDDKSLEGALYSSSNTGPIPADRSVTSATNESNAPIRTGTSLTRLEEQKQTYASGEMEEGSPAVVDHGHGDKSALVEPTTVGQANKNVEVPEATSSEEQPEKPGMVQQAKNVADSAYAATAAAVTSVSQTVMHAAGYGDEADKSAEETISKKTQDISLDKEETDQPKAEDPRIDKMEDNQVEEFIREQYGHRPSDPK